jgi:hypothetical protein
VCSIIVSVRMEAILISGRVLYAAAQRDRS